MNKELRLLNFKTEVHLLKSEMNKQRNEKVQVYGLSLKRCDNVTTEVPKETLKELSSRHRISRKINVEIILLFRNCPWINYNNLNKPPFIYLTTKHFHRVFLKELK